jgi:hypothetical protein
MREIETGQKIDQFHSIILSLLRAIETRSSLTLIVIKTEGANTVYVAKGYIPRALVPIGNVPRASSLTVCGLSKLPREDSEAVQEERRRYMVRKSMKPEFGIHLFYRKANRGKTIGLQFKSHVGRIPS